MRTMLAANPAVWMVSALKTNLLSADNEEAMQERRQNEARPKSLQALYVWTSETACDARESEVDEKEEEGSESGTLGHTNHPLIRSICMSPALESFCLSWSTTRHDPALFSASLQWPEIGEIVNFSNQCRVGHFHILEDPCTCPDLVEILVIGQLALQTAESELGRCVTASWKSGFLGFRVSLRPSTDREESVSAWEEHGMGGWGEKFEWPQHFSSDFAIFLRSGFSSQGPSFARASCSCADIAKFGQCLITNPSSRSTFITYHTSQCRSPISPRLQTSPSSTATSPTSPTLTGKHHYTLLSASLEQLRPPPEER